MKKIRERTLIAENNRLNRDNRDLHTRVSDLNDKVSAIGDAINEALELLKNGKEAEAKLILDREKRRNGF